VPGRAVCQGLSRASDAAHACFFRGGRTLRAVVTGGALRGPRTMPAVTASTRGAVTLPGYEHIRAVRCAQGTAFSPPHP